MPARYERLLLCIQQGPPPAEVFTDRQREVRPAIVPANGNVAWPRFQPCEFAGFLCVDYESRDCRWRLIPFTSEKGWPAAGNDDKTLTMPAQVNEFVEGRT